MAAVPTAGFVPATITSWICTPVCAPAEDKAISETATTAANHAPTRWQRCDKKAKTDMRTLRISFMSTPDTADQNPLRLASDGYSKGDEPSREAGYGSREFIARSSMDPCPARRLALIAPRAYET